MELSINKEKINEYRERAKALVSQMTLEEKVEQTLYKSPEIERLGIKKYNWWNEALHGVARAGTATVFPQAIGMAATFDEELLEKVGDAVSTEARAKFNMQQMGKDSDIYKGLTFWAPNVNIFRDPRWGRGHETFGEDPYLTSRLGVRYIEGLQGHNEKYLKVAACAKHFAVHSGPEALRHEFDAVVSEQDLRETYLPAFKACVQEAHVEAVMGAYNRTNGVPCCGNHRLLIDILRNEWGFEGHVTSDCWAIKDFYEGHHVTSNAQEAAAMAMTNGCDLNCGSLFEYLVQGRTC
jgi:beta-glucosidase